MANSRRSRWDSLRVRWENAFNATMVPATAGLMTTLIIFGVLISFLYPAQVRASNDVPTMLYTPAQLRSTPFELSMGVPNADSLVIEAYVGADGRVQDYRILSGPEDDAEHSSAAEEHADLHDLPAGNCLRSAHVQPRDSHLLQGAGEGVTPQRPQLAIALHLTAC